MLPEAHHAEHAELAWLVISPTNVGQLSSLGRTGVTGDDRGFGRGLYGGAEEMTVKHGLKNQHTCRHFFW